MHRAWIPSCTCWEGAVECYEWECAYDHWLGHWAGIDTWKWETSQWYNLVIIWIVVRKCGCGWRKLMSMEWCLCLWVGNIHLDGKHLSVYFAIDNTVNARQGVPLPDNDVNYSSDTWLSVEELFPCCLQAHNWIVSCRWDKYRARNFCFLMSIGQLGWSRTDIFQGGSRFGFRRGRKSPVALRLSFSGATNRNISNITNISTLRECCGPCIVSIHDSNSKSSLLLTYSTGLNLIGQL